RAEPSACAALRYSWAMTTLGVKMRTKASLFTSVLATLICGCSSHWEMYRHNILRSGGQLNASDLSNPAKMSSLSVRWTFTVPATDTAAGMNPGFRASPIEYGGRVYVGSGNGRVYTLDANSGAVLWKYPAPPAQPLRSQFTCNPSSWGISSSATIAKVGGVTAVIFGAPDLSVG